jgi:DNA topoisomerase-3
MFAPSINLIPLIEEQVSHPAWGDFAASLLPPHGNPDPRNGRQSDEAHPPIHPTKRGMQFATHQENQIYEVAGSFSFVRMCVCVFPFCRCKHLDVAVVV